MRRLLALAVLLPVLFFALAGAAIAATYVAGPGSTRTGTPCTRATPCSLAFTIDVTNGLPGDVLVLAGNYTLSGQHTLHGSSHLFGDGDARPVITMANNVSSLTVGTGGGMLAIAEGVALIGASSGTPLVVTVDGIVDDVMVRSGGPGAAVQLVGNGIIRDTLVLATGTKGEAIRVDGATDAIQLPRLVNVTARATGLSSIGIHVVGECGGLDPDHFDMTNTIARGAPLDLWVEERDCANGIAVDTRNSNWRRSNMLFTGIAGINGHGGDQTTPALTDDTTIFADDMHQKPGSPTIDAGFTSPIAGVIDPDHDQRFIGIVDIGADEFPGLPAAVTGDATEVTTGSATLSGSASANTRETHALIEWGPTTSYGTTVGEVVIAAGAGPVPLSAALTGLAPGTTYHYRVRAVDQNPLQPVTGAGEDRTFTTAAIPPAPPAFSALSVRRTFAQAKLSKPGLPVSLTLARDGSDIEVTLTAKVRASRRAPARKRRLAHLLVRRRSAGSRVVLHLRASRAVRRLLRAQRSRRVRATLKVKVTPPGGPPLTQTVRVILTR